MFNSTQNFNNLLLNSLNEDVKSFKYKYVTIQSQDKGIFINKHLVHERYENSYKFVLLIQIGQCS